MTRKQKEVLDYIRSYLAEHGYSPSLQNIADGCGLPSKSGGWRMVESLIEEGRLRKRGNRARSLEVVENRTTRPNLAIYTLSELEQEVKRRGFVMGDIHRDDYGGRTFVPFGGGLAVAYPSETIT
jgi:SOS-response transcriptional repressor LexA